MPSHLTCVSEAFLYPWCLYPMPRPGPQCQNVRRTHATMPLHPHTDIVTLAALWCPRRFCATADATETVTNPRKPPIKRSRAAPLADFPNSHDALRFALCITDDVPSFLLTFVRSTLVDVDRVIDTVPPTPSSRRHLRSYYGVLQPFPFSPETQEPQPSAHYKLENNV